MRAKDRCTPKPGPFRLPLPPASPDAALVLKLEYSLHHEAASTAVAAERTQTLAAQLTARF